MLSFREMYSFSFFTVRVAKKAMFNGKLSLTLLPLYIQIRYYNYINICVPYSFLKFNLNNITT